MGFWETDAEMKELSEELDGLHQQLQDVNQAISTKGSTPGRRDRAANLTKSIERLGNRHAELYQKLQPQFAELKASGVFGTEGGSHGMEERERRGAHTKIGAWVKNSLEQKAVAGGWANWSGPNDFSFSPVEYSREALDFLAASSVGLESGFKKIRTSHRELVLPHLKADPSSDFYPEATDVVHTFADAEELRAVPKRVSSLTALSNELIADSQPDALDELGKSLLRSVGLRLDWSFFEGSGTGEQIKGLKNIAGTQTISMGTDGATLTSLDPLVDAFGKLWEADAKPTAIVCHPRTFATLAKLKTNSSDSLKPLLLDYDGNTSDNLTRRIAGVPVYTSSQLSVTETQGVSTDCSSIYVYQADQVLAVLRDQAIVERNDARLFPSWQTELRCSVRADMIVGNPESVVRITGVRP